MEGCDNILKKAKEDETQIAIPELMRETYKELGLTRDMVILKGTLEAQLFQVAVLLVAVPAESSNFAVVFNIDCSNCKWAYRTTSYAQIIQLEAH